MTVLEKPIKSPCVNVCYLNDQDICQGCYRSGQEISGWMRMDNDQRRAVYAKVAEREAASPFVTISKTS